MKSLDMQLWLAVIVLFAGSVTAVLVSTRNEAQAPLGGQVRTIVCEAAILPTGQLGLLVGKPAR